MPTFQNHPPRKPGFPISFGIERAIIAEISKQPNVTEQALKQAVRHGFTLVYPEKSVDLELSNLTHTVLERIQALQEQKQSGGPPTRFGKTLGSKYSEWLSDLDSEQICVYLADYDINQALQYYWRLDTETVRDAVVLKAQHDSQKILAGMEQSLYGFGGKYSDDQGASSGAQHDLNSDEGVAALKAFGF